MSTRCVIKELSPKEDINNGDLFQTLVFERLVSHDFDDSDFSEVQQNMHKFANQWEYEEKSYKGVTTTPCKNLTGSRDQQHHKSWNNFPLKHNVSIFQTEEKTYECNQVEKSMKNCSSVSPLQIIPPSVKTN
eukprot:bmy_22277T0